MSYILKRGNNVFLNAGRIVKYSTSASSYILQQIGTIASAVDVIIDASNNRILVLTSNNTICVYDATSYTFTNTINLSGISGTCCCFCTYMSDQIIVGTTSGVYFYNKTTFAFIKAITTVSMRIGIHFRSNPNDPDTLLIPQGSTSSNIVSLKISTGVVTNHIMPFTEPITICYDRYNPSIFYVGYYVTANRILAEVNMSDFSTNRSITNGFIGNGNIIDDISTTNRIIISTPSNNAVITFCNKSSLTFSQTLPGTIVHTVIDIDQTERIAYISNNTLNVAIKQ